MDGIMSNYMNSGLVPQQQNVVEWLRNMGIDPTQLAQMANGGNLRALGSEAMQAQGWDGVGQKLAFLGQQAMARRAAQPPRLPMGHPGLGSVSDIERQRTAPGSKGGVPGTGVVSDRERRGGGGIMSNIFGNGTFGDIAGILFPGVARPGLMAPLPYMLGRKLFK
jgi:hypothetical protein